MSICKANLEISAEIKAFIEKVRDVKEESITDYLLWKWKEADDRFNYINVEDFTRMEESTTSGADFEMELWLVGRTFHFPLVFQAKKFIKSHDSYVAKLNYPDNTQNQLKTLLSYSKSTGKMPFYMFYSLPDEKTKTMCAHGDTDGALFMADANTIKKFADKTHGPKISRNNLLSVSNPFHCMFCCPLAEEGQYINRYFPMAAPPTEKASPSVPGYVDFLLREKTNEINQDVAIALINQYQLRSFRAVGVYDMRDDRPSSV